MVAADTNKVDELTAAALFLYLLVNAELRRRRNSAEQIYRWWTHDKTLRPYPRPSLEALEPICRAMRLRIPSGYKLEVLAHGKEER